MRRVILLLGLALALSGTASAQFRTIPDGAQRGVIRHVGGMVVSVDGRQIRLAPGATIRNERNLIVVPVALPPNGALAEFTLDTGGQISRVWLLTREEAERPKKPEGSR